MAAVSRRPEQQWLCDVLLRMPLARAPIGTAWADLEANRPIILPRLSAEHLEHFAQSEEHLRILLALDPKSAILVPLYTHAKLVGAILLVSTDPSHIYSQSDVRLVEQLAQRAAYALENALLYAEAQRAIQSRDSMLSVVAHDLRNPLGNVLMQAALLRRPGSEPERRSQKPLQMIERAGKRMNRIIQDLLDLTRIEEGQLSVERVVVSARQAMSDVFEAQQPLARAASHELVLEVSRELPDVWADRDRLLQVFENLIGNAIKFTPSGSTITVGAAPSNGDVMFWVEDTGPGILPENMPHVFDRFWQAQRNPRHGVGLGLAIVKGLVEAHRGRVWVESTVGRGTTFFFTIPTAPRVGLSPEEAVRGH
jgi:signal transduction histidine kinase